MLDHCGECINVLRMYRFLVISAAFQSYSVLVFLDYFRAINALPMASFIATSQHFYLDISETDIH